jgi:adenosylcobinamide-GDP ribazoletransferase
MGFEIPELKTMSETDEFSAWMRRAVERVRGSVVGGWAASAASLYHGSGWFDDLRVAVSLLTRVPMPHPDGAVPVNLARAQRVFPLIGAAVGLAVGLVYWILSATGIPALAAAVLALAASALLTGALHEDGLGDVADGFGGGRDRDAKLAIMRDSRLGTYGALAVITAFVAKVAALEAMAPSTALAALVAAHALGRAGIPVMAAYLPHARSDGLGQGAGRPQGSEVAIAVGSAVVIALLFLPFATALIAILLAVGGTAVVVAVAQRQIGGVTGDVFGAAEQVVEIAVLLAVAARAAT